MKLFLCNVFLFLMCSCSGVSMITPERKVADNVDTSKLYKQEFLLKINAAKEKLRKGNHELALKDLAAIKDDGLTPAEKSTKRNLTGVVNF